MVLELEFNHLFRLEKENTILWIEKFYKKVIELLIWAGSNSSVFKNITLSLENLVWWEKESCVEWITAPFHKLASLCQK